MASINRHLKAGHKAMREGNEELALEHFDRADELEEAGAKQGFDTHSLFSNCFVAAGLLILLAGGPGFGMLLASYYVFGDRTPILFQLLVVGFFLMMLGGGFLPIIFLPFYASWSDFWKSEAGRKSLQWLGCGFGFLLLATVWLIVAGASPNDTILSFFLRALGLTNG